VFIPLAVAFQNLFRARHDLDVTVFFLGLVIVGSGIIGIQAIVPRSVKSSRDRLVGVSNGVRRISKELATFVVGDEPNSAFGTVYFLQWLSRRIVIGLLCAILLAAALTHFFPVIDTWMERLFPYMAGAIAAIYVIYLIFAVGAYGPVQALIALDATVAATPAPRGHTHSLTIAWTNQDRLRHSLVHDSPEAIKPIAKWLKNALGNPSLEGSSETP